MNHQELGVYGIDLPHWGGFIASCCMDGLSLAQACADKKGWPYGQDPKRFGPHFQFSFILTRGIRIHQYTIIYMPKNAVSMGNMVRFGHGRGPMKVQPPPSLVSHQPQQVLACADGGELKDAQRALAVVTLISLPSPLAQCHWLVSAGWWFRTCL